MSFGKMRAFISGPPGSGKSTLVREIIELLRKKGLKVGGISTPEIKENGRRVGFEVVDLSSGKRKVFAHVEGKGEARFGKYNLFIKDFEEIAIPALRFALEECDVVVIDEIGKMEFFSNKFKEVLEEVLNSDKILLAVLHRAYLDKFGKYGEVFWLEKGHFEEVREKIKEKLELE